MSSPRSELSICQVVTFHFTLGLQSGRYQADNAAYFNPKLSKGIYLMIRILIFSALCQVLIMNLILDLS